MIQAPHVPGISGALAGTSTAVPLPVGERESTANLRVLHDQLVEHVRAVVSQVNATVGNPHLSDAGKVSGVQAIRTAALSRYDAIMPDGPLAYRIRADAIDLRQAATKALDIKRELSPMELELLRMARDSGDPRSRAIPVAKAATDGIDAGDNSLALAILRAPPMLDPLSGSLTGELRGNLRSDLERALLHKIKPELAGPLYEVRDHLGTLDALHTWTMDALLSATAVGGPTADAEAALRARMAASDPRIARMQAEMAATAGKGKDPRPTGTHPSIDRPMTSVN